MHERVNGQKTHFNMNQAHGEEIQQDQARVAFVRQIKSGRGPGFLEWLRQPANTAQP